MTSQIEPGSNLERRIKKHIYGKTQTAFVVPPAGLVETTRQEISRILAVARPKVTSKKGEDQKAEDQKEIAQKEESQGEAPLERGLIKLTDLDYEDILALTLCLRTATDVRLLVHRGRAPGHTALTREINQAPLDLLLFPGQAVRLKVDSTASHVFHERELARILTEALKARGFDVVKASEEGDTAAHGAGQGAPTLFAFLYKDTLSLSLSLAGESLAIRGYKAVAAHKAPLREDQAAACITEAFEALNSFVTLKPELRNEPFAPGVVLVPFAGSGTLGFESWLALAHFQPFLFNRSYAFESLRCHKPLAVAHMRASLAKAFAGMGVHQSSGEIATPSECPIFFVEKDSSAIDNLKTNATHFATLCKAASYPEPKLDVHLADLFSLGANDLMSTFAQAKGDVFLPLNPPYGLRLSASAQGNPSGDGTAFYERLGRWVANLAEACRKENRALGGFVLCPDEKTWSRFCSTSRTHILKTTHFTQGGLDIRLCLFRGL